MTLTKRERVIEVRIRWRTEALTEVTVPRPKLVADARRTDAQVVARVRELAPTHTATQIALLLNEEGLRPGLGGDFTASKVDWIGASYDIPLDCPEGPGFCPSGQRGDGRYSALAAAELLNVNVSTIADWCNERRGERVYVQAPMGLAGLRSHRRSSPSSASRFSDIGNDGVLVSAINIWYSRTSRDRLIRSLSTTQSRKHPVRRAV